jgi:periplasmic divalent cation tolerance protein
LSLRLDFSMNDKVTSHFVELILSCGSWQEAQRIADSLLEKRLVACVEFFDIKSKYQWHGNLEEATEVKLIMQTIADNFAKVETEVKKLHSYETFVLHSLPIAQTSEAAAKWLNDETTS